LIGAATAPPLPCCAVTDRGFTARGRRARPRRRRAPAAGGGSRRRRGVPLVANLRHAAEDEATKADRLLDLRMPANDVPYACGPNSAAGRRGRRRSAYEAPRAAADGGTRLGGAESKRRRRPRLPAPPSRVTLLVRAVVHAFAVVRLARLGRSGRLGRRGRACRPRLFDQVLRLLVEAHVHVVARLEDGLAPGAHDVGLAVVLGAENGADRLPLMVG